MLQTNASETHLLTGFGNEFQSEAVPGALPVGRNSPQRAPLGLYAEVISGSAFTAPRADNRRTWMYRRQPSAVSGAYERYAQPFWISGGDASLPAVPPDPLRWSPAEVPAGAPTDFLDGVRAQRARILLVPRSYKESKPEGH